MGLAPLPAGPLLLLQRAESPIAKTSAARPAAGQLREANAVHRAPAPVLLAHQGLAHRIHLTRLRHFRKGLIYRRRKIIKKAYDLVADDGRNGYH